MSDASTSPPATSQKAAELKSPGTARSIGSRRSVRPTATRVPSTFT